MSVEVSINWMGSEEFVKVYESKLKGPNTRGRPLGRWKDKVEEYLGGEGGVNERGVFEHARRECWVRGSKASQLDR